MSSMSDRLDRDPLEGVRAKLARAREGHALLVESFDEFVDKNREGPFGTEIIRRRHPLAFVVRWVGHPKVPPRWSVLLGEFFHNLRSSLDHLTHQLVLANDGEPHSRTAFPVFRDEQMFDERASDMVRGMSDEAFDVIRTLQPFATSPSKPRRSTLWNIHNLNIIDKHRLLHLVDFWTDHVTLELTPTSRHQAVVVDHWTTGRVRLNKGDVLAYLQYVPTPEAPPRDLYVEVEFQAFLDVAISDGEFLSKEGQPMDGGMSVRRLMSVSLSHVENDLVPRLAGFLE